MPPSNPAAVAGDQKLRLLALHGFSQDAQTFRSRIGSMRKGLKSRAELFFVDAPHLVQDVPGEVLSAASGREDGRTWWTWEGSDRPSISTSYTGWEVGHEAILAALKQNEPIHGVLGFSQGAVAAALHLATAPSLLEGASDSIQLPKFAILVGGFLPRDPHFAEILKTAGIPIPSLHIYGSGDTMVTTDRSIHLMGAFAEDRRESHEHPGGHMVPTCTGEFKALMAEFLDRMRQEV